MRSSGESIIAAGGAPLGVPDIVLREEDVLDGVQEFGVKFIGAADEASSTSSMSCGRADSGLRELSVGAAKRKL